MKKGLFVALSLAGAAAAVVAIHKRKCHCPEGECTCKKGCCGDIDNKVVKFHRPSDSNEEK